MTIATHDTPLAGKVALVTGASSGIGAATALALARLGARVGLVGRRRERLDEGVEAIASAGGHAVAAPADVTSPGELSAAYAAVREALGPLDILVANAGVMHARPFTSVRPGEWRAQFDVNVGGLLDSVATALPDLTRDGRAGVSDVVVISSIAAFMPFPDFSVYNASKAAASWFAQSLRAELAPQQVRVTTVEPGLTATELQGRAGGPEVVAALADFSRQISALDPEDVAELVGFAVSRRPGLALPRLVVQPVLQP